MSVSVRAGCDEGRAGGVTSKMQTLGRRFGTSKKCQNWLVFLSLRILKDKKTNFAEKA